MSNNDAPSVQDTEMDSDGYDYRIVVGEIGNEIGHIIPISVNSERLAKLALAKELRKYGRDGWGRVEYRTSRDGVNGVPVGEGWDWQRLDS